MANHNPHGQSARTGAVIILLSIMLPLFAMPGIVSPQPTAAATLSLTSSLSSPQFVGTPITWTATISPSPSMPVVYQFSVGYSPTGPFTIVRDFSTRPNFSEAPLEDGLSYVAVTVKQTYTATATISTVVPYMLLSRITGGLPVVSTTANPLVALYSAPPCSEGQMVVVFRPLTAVESPTTTNAEPCVAGQSRNFLVAGMLPRTTYNMVNVVISGTTRVTSTQVLTFTTGNLLPSGLPVLTVVQPPTTQSNVTAKLLVHLIGGDPSPVATDLQGRVVWYAQEADFYSVQPVRIQPVGGDIGTAVFVFGSDGQLGANLNVFREIDLASNPVQETNVEAINAQLAARGQGPIYDFNHDALRLPNGNTAVIAHTQEYSGTTSYMGNMVLVLDRNLQVVWTWDGFTCPNCAIKLPLSRGPTLGETCPRNCPVPGGPGTLEWLHANALSWSPLDGNLVVSLRNQDWVIKVNYANGTGDSSILWRLGPQGDFSLIPLSPQDPYPWFSHQHDASFITGLLMTMFDNGNTRCAAEPAGCHSRGQAYLLNEQTMVATQTLSVDVGSYSAAYGTAQRLTNGNYAFTSGSQTAPPPPFAQDVEVLPTGTTTNIQYEQQVSISEYRAWRLSSLYATTNLSCPSCPPN